MSNIIKKEKIENIINISEKLGITSNQFGDNTDVSNMTAYNILNRKSRNPRMHNLDAMLSYLEKKVISTNIKDSEKYNQKIADNSDITEPEESYETKNKEELLRIVLEFSDNFETLKNHRIIKNIIEIEVLKRLMQEKEQNK